MTGSLGGRGPVSRLVVLVDSAASSEDAWDSCTFEKIRNPLVASRCNDPLMVRLRIGQAVCTDYTVTLRDNAHDHHINCFPKRAGRNERFHIAG